MEREHLTEHTELGRITIGPDAIAQIVGHTTAECYGVVAMAGKGLTGRALKRRLTRDKLTQGIEVSGSENGVRLDLHVVVEYGLNLAEVAAAIRSRVAYEVERLTGLTVAAVEVHIDDVRKSA
ncbi:MAG TPA: Asp23/Gls24 family envelope stress response protein [Gaiellaceae bacterium]|nr:Asp23/Gls24 family envelope stress response protein [Gaiellaceae bacterium]